MSSSIEQSRLGITSVQFQTTISEWFGNRKTAETEPPASRQHFDVWQFATSDKDKGQQLSRQDKQRLAGQLWQTFAHLQNGERVQEIVQLLAVSERSVQAWTKD